MSIIIFVVMYYISNVVMEVINIYELGLKEYERIRKEKIIDEIKKDIKNDIKNDKSEKNGKNDKINIDTDENSPSLSQL